MDPEFFLSDPDSGLAKEINIKLKVHTGAEARL
jgi:hypothetical protein